MSDLITNQEQLLSDVLNNILPSTKNLYILVGYFYFSGFKDLHDELKDKQIRIGNFPMHSKKDIGKLLSALK